MAKVRFCCNSGANIHSCRSEEFDTETDLGLAKGEWETLTESMKQDIVDEWAWDRLEIYYEET